MSESDAKEVSPPKPTEEPEEQPQDAAARTDDEKTEATDTVSVKDEKTKNMSISELMRKMKMDTDDWADMTEKDEEEEKKLHEQAVHDAIVSFTEPFMILVSNLVEYASPEDLFFFFGGDEKVSDLFFCSHEEAAHLEALVELKSREALADALLLNKTELYKRSVDVEYVDLQQGRCYSIPQTAAELAAQAAAAAAHAPPSEPTGRPSYGGSSNYGGDRGGKMRGNRQQRPQNQPSNVSDRSYRSSTNDVRGMPRDNMNRGPPPNRQFATGANAFPNHGGPNHRQRGNFHDDRHRNDYRGGPSGPPSLFDRKDSTASEDQPRKPAEKPTKQSIFGDAKPKDTHSKQMELWQRMDNEKKEVHQQPKTQAAPSAEPQLPKEPPAVQPPPPVEPTKLLTRKGQVEMKESPEQKPKDAPKRPVRNPPPRGDQHRRVDTGTVQKLLHSASKSNSSLKEVGTKAPEGHAAHNQQPPPPKYGPSRAPKSFRPTRKPSTQSNATSKDEETTPAEAAAPKAPPTESAKQPEAAAPEAPPPQAAEPASASAPPANPPGGSAAADNGATSVKPKKPKSKKTKKEQNVTGNNRFGAFLNHNGEF
ncbi:hypothetical protein M3Y99_00343900 [Aphelenchoides fujianensis]|nr:hypothetical protein M3Y99_00343900 [Aphelenchoides fujianensis]